MKRIKIQPDQDTSSKIGYWSHKAGHRQGGESPRANPDELDESMSMYEVTESAKEVQERVHKLLALAKQILTEQQYLVFILLTAADTAMVRAVLTKEQYRTFRGLGSGGPELTEREAGVVLQITHGRVHQLWEKAREKLQRAYEERT